MNRIKKDRELHIRISKGFEESLKSIANDYGLNKSTLARVILERDLPQYTRNRLF